MSVYGSGNYFAFNGLIAQSGNLSDGALYLDGGVYAFASLDTSVNNAAGPASVTGAITLSGGAVVRVADLFGDADRGTGFALRATVGRSYDSNHTASGRLTISDGAALTLAPEAVFAPGVGVYGGYDTLNAGIGAGGAGLVEVTGAGSSLRTEGTNPLIRIGGASGTASLEITSGGHAGLFALQAGFGVGSGPAATGRVLVSGAGSTLILGGSYGSYVDPAYGGMSATVSIGLAFDADSPDPTGRGYLDVTGGGAVTVQNLDGETDFPLLRFGRDALSYGAGLVDGPGSTLSVIQSGVAGDDHPGGATLDVGEAGEGRLNVRNGGRVEVSGDLALLAVSRPPADVPVTTEQSRLLIESGGQVLVDAGANEGGFAVIGNGTGSNGALTVTGDESLLSLKGDAPDTIEATAQGAALIVGLAGAGVVSIETGGHIDINGGDDRLPGASIGAEGGSGTLTLAGGTLSIDGTRTGTEAARLVIGEGTGSSGSVTVSGGGRIENLAPDGITLVAATTGATGQLTVDGSSSTVAAGKLALVGAGVGANGDILASAGGDGVLALRAGGKLTAETTVIGATGTLELDEGQLISDIDLHGRLSLSPGKLTTEVIEGALVLRPGAVIALDVDAFARASTDRLVFKTPQTFDVADLALDLTLDPEIDFFAGDSFVFASAPTPFLPSSQQVIDQGSGRSFLLVAEGISVRLEAVQGTPITLRSDGTIESVELPSAVPFLDAMSSDPSSLNSPIGLRGLRGPAPIFDLAANELTAFDTLLF